MIERLDAANRSYLDGRGGSATTKLDGGIARVGRDDRLKPASATARV